MVLITIVPGAYKPTYNWGAPHCIYIYIKNNKKNNKYLKMSPKRNPRTPRMLLTCRSCLEPEESRLQGTPKWSESERRLSMVNILLIMVYIRGYYMVIIWLMMVNNVFLVGGWPTPLKNHGVKVSWDDDYSQLNGTIKFMCQNTNQIRVFVSIFWFTAMFRGFPTFLCFRSCGSLWTRSTSRPDIERSGLTPCQLVFSLSRNRPIKNKLPRRNLLKTTISCICFRKATLSSCNVPTMRALGTINEVSFARLVNPCAELRYCHVQFFFRKKKLYKHCDYWCSVLAIDYYLVGGWPTPLKSMEVSWDDEIPIYGKITNVPNHQPVIDYCW